jgi:hypothetical protein
MYFITTEMRMAGYDPTGDSDASLAPDAAVRTTTTFSMNITDGANDGIDNNGDGNTDEPTESSNYITYDLVNDQITRTDGTGITQILADNIEALDFVYHGINPADPNDINYRFSTVEAAANPGDLRSVNITIIARIPVVMAVSYQVQDNNVYRNIDNDIVLNKNLAPDNFRRIMLQKTIKLRNMGLS